MLIANPIISIITPTYNHEKYISDCIESVLNQTFENWEMLIINDGSTDGTARIVEQYTQLDKRIRLISQENKGIFALAENYNKALGFSRGEYIAVLEGDDIWYPTKLELQLKAFQENPESVLSWGQVNIINGDGEITETDIPKLDDPQIQYFNNLCLGEIMNLLFYRNCMPALTLIFKKSTLIELGGFIKVSGMPTIDLPTIMSLSLKGSFCFVPQILGAWRSYANQTTKRYPSKLSEDYYTLVKDFSRKNADNETIRGILKNNKIDDYHKRKILISYSRSGRYKLIRKDFLSARTDYWKSIIMEPFLEPGWKLRSAIGLLFSFLHLNVEGLARTLGRKHYTKI